MKPFILLPIISLTLGSTQFVSAAPAASEQSPAHERARLIILADMGNEPDEEQQMMHLLIASNQIDIEGLIAVTGKFLRPESKEAFKQKIRPDLFLHLIDGYEKVYPNLQLHAQGWPAPDALRQTVASGQTGYGMRDVGEGKSSEGSRHIITALTRPDPRPLHFVMNAGSNTLAQALRDYRASHTPAELKTLIAKMRVFENQAQDDAGAWICHEFPEIFWIRSRNQTKCYGGPTDKNLGPHCWQPYDYSVQGQDDWAREHIRTQHGALGELYPQRIIDEKVHFIEGGGTIPWLGLVSHGLTDSSEPSWGGWSGRYTHEKVLNVPSPFADIVAEEQVSIPYASFTDLGVKDRWVNPLDGKIHDDFYAPIWHWRVAMWNDLRARMDWCVQPYSKANHPPHAILGSDASDAILRLAAKPGAVMSFDASASTDPDGNPLRFNWWIYSEAGRRPYGKSLPIESSTSGKISLPIPSDAAGKELHLILEVWDQNDTVPLVDYRRVVISVDP